MIFGREYDDALWLMLKGDKKNREVLVKFLKSIPKELYDQINERIYIVQDYIRNNVSLVDRQEKLFHDRVVGADGLLYWYMIDPYCCSLNLGYAVKTGDCSYDDVLEITLYPDPGWDLVTSCDSKSIGKVEYHTIEGESGKKFGSVEEKKVNYVLVKLPHVMAVGFCENTSLAYELKFVNLKKKPEEMFLSDINKRGKIRRRKIRTRRLTNIGENNGV